MDFTTNNNLTDRELLLLISQSVTELKEEMKNMKRDIASTYATKSEVAAIATQVALAATKSELDVLKEKLEPYMNIWNQIMKIAIGILVTALMGLIVYQNVPK